MRKPGTWDECEKLLDSPLLQWSLRIRLVELAFTSDSAVAIRAIELLNNSGGSPDDGLGAVPIDQLERVRNRIIELASGPDAATSS